MVCVCNLNICCDLIQIWGPIFKNKISVWALTCQLVMGQPQPQEEMEQIQEGEGSEQNDHFSFSKHKSKYITSLEMSLFNKSHL